MIIETGRLRIRLIEEADWPGIKRIWEDFSQSEYAQYDCPHDTDDDVVKTRILRWADANRHGMDHLFFAVCLHDEIIGYTAFNKREEGYEIGYCFHSGYHGKGYAKEAHFGIFRVLRELGIQKFSAGTGLANLPSVRLLESLGFRKIGEEKVSFYKDEDGNDIVFDGGIFELELR